MLEAFEEVTNLVCKIVLKLRIPQLLPEMHDPFGLNESVAWSASSVIRDRTDLSASLWCVYEFPEHYSILIH